MRILSLGWGVQSFTIVAMVALGELEPVDYAVHADTGYESSLTYAFAERWTGWLEERGVKVVTTQLKNKKNIYDLVEIRCLPAYTDTSSRKGGQLRRQCTNRWKIQPLRKWISGELARLDLKKIPGVVEMWIGITTDEYHRIRESDVKYIKNRYPLIDLGMSRDDCKDWLYENGLEVPPKSGCIICPYRSKKAWRDVYESPNDWAVAVEIDRKIRKVSPPYDLFLHCSRIPLEDVDMRTQEEIGQMRLL